MLIVIQNLSNNLYLCFRADENSATPAQIAQQLLAIQPKPVKSKASRYIENTFVDSLTKVPPSNNISTVSPVDILTKSLFSSSLEKTNKVLSAEHKELLINNNELLTNLSFVDLQWKLCTNNMSELVENVKNLRFHLDALVENHTLCSAYNEKLSLQMYEQQKAIRMNETLFTVQTTDLLFQNSELAKNLSLCDLHKNLCENELSKLIQNEKKLQDFLNKVIANNTQCFTYNEYLSLQLTGLQNDMNKMKNMMYFDNKTVAPVISMKAQPVTVCNCSALSTSLTNCNHTGLELCQNTGTVDQLIQSCSKKMSNMSFVLNRCLDTKDVFADQLNTCLNAELFLTKTVDLCNRKMSDTTFLLNAARIKLNKTRNILRSMKLALKTTKTNMSHNLEQCVSRNSGYAYFLQNCASSKQFLNTTAEQCRHELHAAKDTLRHSTRSILLAEVRYKNISNLLENSTLEYTKAIQNSSSTVKMLQISLNQSRHQVYVLTNIIQLCEKSVNKTVTTAILGNSSLINDPFQIRQAIIHKITN